MIVPVVAEPTLEMVSFLGFVIFALQFPSVKEGANFFWGEDDWTEFGQMEDNSDIYLRVRYSF